MTRPLIIAAALLSVAGAARADADIVTNPKTGLTCFGGKPEDCRFGPDPALRHDGWYSCMPPLGVRVQLWSDWHVTISCEEQPKGAKP